MESLKIKKDPYYSVLFEKTKDLDLCKKAGWFDDQLDSIDYALWLRSTPTHKLEFVEQNQTPIVILSTGSFDPLHLGHIHMMELAKTALEEKGFFVAGGYLSPSHDSYVLQKSSNQSPIEERLIQNYQMLSTHPWLMIDPFEGRFVPKAINFTDVILRLEKYLQKYYHPKTKVAYVFGSDNQDFILAFQDHDLALCVQRNGNIQKQKFLGNHIFISENAQASVSSTLIRSKK